ncbi:PBP1A family penicillin-binding protein [Acidicapsa dinghuensis]|uniref:peptidoglycan glycosyltransferase n=1 Tax=Acidicapsa dinghuensis TaxID=2218256 RepID=A0ABW1EEY0_9BACT|nr:PBP1A family penicillin-binding protein [Acidicapsa dinghuensis]
MASTSPPQRPASPAERNSAHGGFRPPQKRTAAPAANRRQRKLAGRVAFGILFFLAAVTGSLAGLMLVYSADLPQIHDLERYRPSTTTDLYDRKGRPFGSFALERRIIVNYDDFAPVLRQAVISIEDKNFESHWGINVFRVMGAAWHDIASHGRAQGASTLTMQLARNLFLSAERTTARKLQEAYLAIQIERSFTKEQIFTLYGNQIYLGHGNYGFEAASEFYFSKHASQLNLTEAALLAGLPKGPVAYSPLINPEKALRRRNLVLTEMENDKAITHQQAEIARDAPLGLHIAQPQMSVAPWYIEEVRRELEKQFGAEEVHEDGLRVETTLDVDLQQTANHAVLDGVAADERRRGWKGARYNVITQGGDMDEYKHPDWAMKSGPGDYVHALVTSVLPLEIRARVGSMPIVMIPEDWKWTGQAHGDDLVKPGDIIYVHLDLGMEGTAHKATLEQDSGVEGSLMAIDNTSGDILAMVGGRDYSTSQFNRATQAERQTGSSFKPYVYTTAIEEGVKPTDIIIDAPVSFGSYTPHNYEGDYKGAMTIQNAFAESRNIPALKLAARVGIHKVIDTAHRFGVTSNIPAYLPVALGAVEITLEQQVASYSVFPNDGIRVTPRLIRKVENADGITLWEQTPEVKEVTTQQTARTMMGMLKEVTRSGTGAAAAQLKHALGGKTGTTSDFTDAWFLGFSPSVTCGVWVGYDSRQSLGDKEQGARVALPIWIDFMREAIKGKDGETFPGDSATAETAKAEAAKSAVIETKTTATKASPGITGAATAARPVSQSSRPVQQNPAPKPAPPVIRPNAIAPQSQVRPAMPSIHPALPNSTSSPPPRPVVKPALPQ